MTDYHDFTTRDTPASERRRLGVGDVWRNEAECRKCGSVIRSRNRHDFVSCGCGAIAVDGGSWYMRGVGNPGDFIDRSEMFADVGEKDAA